MLNVDQPEISLQHATESVLRHVAGSTAMDQVLTEGRELMASEIKERLQLVPRHVPHRYHRDPGQRTERSGTA